MHYGVYREILRPERLAYTFEFEGMPGHVSLETMTFEEYDGRTKLVANILFDTVEDLEGMVNSGMEEGASEGMDRFTELLKAEQTGSQRNSDTKRRELTISRVFDAPQELVFKAWTDPKLVAQWW